MKEHKKTVSISKTKQSPIRQSILNFCKVCSIAVLLNLLFLFLILSLLQYYKDINTIYILSNQSSPHRVSPKFVSIGLDASVLAEAFHGFNMSDEKLLKMINYLKPAYLRVGGNLGDKLWFVRDNVTFATQDSGNISFYNQDSFVGTRNYTLSGSQWIELVRLASETKLDLVFGLNALIRFENGSWDYRNAEELLKFSDQRNLRVNWELGNEPNSFKHKFNESVNATQLAEDFITLRNILNRYEMYKKSLLVGPDANRIPSQDALNYLTDFLNIAGSAIDGITWHQYYLDGHIAKPEDFLKPSVLDSLIGEINAVNDIADVLNLKNKPVWLGETSSAYGGGAPNISDRFLASFCWLDKLGLSAKMGIDVVVRQSIFGGDYALLDEYYNPNPDWWVSVLYKLLVGRTVVPSYTSAKKTIRLYAHCTRSLPFYYDYPTIITVFGVNMGGSHEIVHIEGLPKPSGANKSVIYAYELTSGCNTSLRSKKIRCNGELLNLLPNHNLPKIRPKILERKKCGVVMPPYSLVFWIIPDTRVEACQV